MIVNGKNVEIESKEISLLEYLLDQEYDINRIAVELNGSIIKKSMYSETRLSKGDKVEIVCFIGGG